MSSATDSLALAQLDSAPIPEAISNADFMAAPDSLKSNSISASETVIPTQIAQWVYIQTPPKITMSTPVVNRTNSANIVVNSMAPLQISSLGPTITNKNLPLNNQGVILAHSVVNNAVKQQHLFIQKPTGVPAVGPSSIPTNGPKNTLAYLTMVKSTSQHLGASSMANQQYVVAPMPKLTSNRLPATITTSCVQPKFALMPVSLQSALAKPPSTKHKVFNLTIADGQLQSESNGAIRIMCDNDNRQNDVEVTSYFRGARDDPTTKLLCKEAMEPMQGLASVEEMSYELSIVEDSGCKNDVSFTITIPDDADKTKSQLFNSRDSHKFPPKHGVSILKKNFNLDAVKPDKSLIISSIPNSITTISDSNTKEVRITASSNFNSEPATVVTDHKLGPQKPERRRKSHFAYRKDYDEVVVTSSYSWDEDEDDQIQVKKAASVADVVEIQVIKEKPDINMNATGFDAKKILKWEHGIGTLPGSQIKFHINEFGFLEYLRNEEQKQAQDKKIAKPKPKPTNIKREELQEEMHCLECGCYGMPSEFISPKFCSYDCQKLGLEAAKKKEAKLKRKSKSWLKKNSELITSEREIKSEREEVPSEEESTSNENSQDKFNYPWTCTKKGFSWAKYLDHIKAKAVPVKYFKDPFPYNRNGFRPGMKLEGVDPHHPSYFCVLSVAEVIGYRLRLHFDGYSEIYDFWVNADSMNIFPAGWCEKYGHILHPPPGYTTANFNWTNYLKQTKSTVAPKHLFVNRAGSAICPNGFRVGMKLEAVDRKNTALVCVGTVTDMMDNRILVHFDSWDDIYDYWADPTSPYIHPVGWCDQNGHNLTPPNGNPKRKEGTTWSNNFGLPVGKKDYPNPETFTWEKYLKETKSSAAPVRAFKQRPVYGFKKGMRLECVDKRVPQLIRAATVDEVKEHQIRISFDGWPDRYSYWVDNDSSDIHPIGWCQKTSHPIEPPLTPDDVYDFLECPTVGCRGQGHIKGSQFSTHSLSIDCPYADENMDKNHVLRDRLLTPDRQLESVVPVSREPRDKEKIKPKVGRPPKIAKLDPPIKVEWDHDEAEEPENVKLPKRKSARSSKSSSSSDLDCKPDLVPLTNGYTNVAAEQLWEKHSNYLRPHIQSNSDPRDWQEDDVVRFVTSLLNCHTYGALFREHKIDGEALLMLNQHDLVTILNMKLGPAIKLYSSIVLLRRSVS